MTRQRICWKNFVKNWIILKLGKVRSLKNAPMVILAPSSCFRKSFLNFFFNIWSCQIKNEGSCYEASCKYYMYLLEMCNPCSCTHLPSSRLDKHYVSKQDPSFLRMIIWILCKIWRVTDRIAEKAVAYQKSTLLWQITWISIFFWGMLIILFRRFGILGFLAFIVSNICGKQWIPSMKVQVFPVFETVLKETWLLCLEGVL